jgi:hypothetical protein
MAYKNVYVEIDLDDFTDEELIEELNIRGVEVPVSTIEIVESIYERRRAGQDYQKLLDDLIYQIIGKLV